MDNKQDTTLGGFEAILGSMIPNYTDPNIDNTDNEPLDDDDLEDIKKNQVDPVANKVKPKKEDTDEPDDDDDDIVEPDNTDDDTDDADDKKTKKDTKTDDKQDNTDDTFDANEMVTGFFDALSEQLGWDDEEEDKKPKTVEELITYFQDVIAENSKPDYASDEIEQLNEYVKNGGDLRKYLTVDAEVDLENIDIEDEGNQKLLVKQLLKEKGFSDKQIAKKISKYEDAGLLEEEAEDALEDLKEINEKKKQELLENLKLLQEQRVKQQRMFYTSVVDGIKELKDIRGIAVPEKDKRTLMDYILKPDADGRTKYQKDYEKGGIKNLIESAYFTMNADKLLASATRKGNNAAIDRFKQSLSNSKVSKTQLNRRDKDTDSIWTSAIRQLRS